MTERLFSYYGDDFTGSTDALEALAANGVPAVLFLDPPDESHLARFRECRAIGVAGESRSRGPAWMDEKLPAVFESLRRLGAPICQYKVCSTFDSSPEYGSIGRALEIGSRIFGNRWTPIAVAAPHLKRYVLFGNLFAAAAGVPYRIDRHPTMSRHPVTPMDEADLRRHLARQTSARIESLDILSLDEGHFDAAMASSPDAVLFDGLDAESLGKVGRLIWTRRPAQPMFAVGSSGLTHALISHWRAAGLIPAEAVVPEGAEVDRIVVVSGSCSPATEAQLRWAMANGYAGFRAMPGCGVLEPALAALGEGRSVALYSALGPADCTGGARGEDLGRYLGTLLLELVRRSGVRRAAVAGGDTSSHAVRQLGIEALTFAGLLSPGAPLCRAYAGDPAIDGMELVLKGGQVGPPDFFEMVRKGKA